MKSLAVSCGIFVSCLLLGACSEEQEPTRPPVRKVYSLVARAIAMPPSAFTGTIRPKVEAQAAFRVLGRVVARNVSVGDMVKRGDVIASLDPLAYELSVKTAQSDLANADAQLATALASEERQRLLAEKKSGSQAAFEAAISRRRTADAAVNRSRANLNLANEQLDYTRLRAEFDGVITGTSAEVGQVVGAGQRIATIAATGERDAVIDVPGERIAGLHIGSPFVVSLQIGGTPGIRGVVREIAPEADQLTRTKRTKIALSDPPPAFRLGSIVTVLSAAAGGYPQIRVPSSSILMKNGTPHVWIVDAGTGTVKLRPVSLDASRQHDGADAAILAGVSPGEHVVTAGVHALADGQQVRED